MNHAITNYDYRKDSPIIPFFFMIPAPMPNFKGNPVSGGAKYEAYYSECIKLYS